jgi:perosamine synthetase
MIRLTIPSIEEEDIRAVAEVLQSGYLVQGPRVKAFEEHLASYLGTQHAVAVSSCTAALHLSLLALGIGPGDRVAVTAFSWPAPANVIALCGAEPIFVDIDPKTYNLDPPKLERVLESTTGVKAVLPVHAFGNMADMLRISEIAARYDVPVIEDAACALGANLQGKLAGTWGVMGCFSFHPRKTITTGEGGIVSTDDDTLAHHLRVLRNHGQDPDSSTPDFVAPGYNLRLTEFQAALGISQLTKLERIVKRRRALAANYDDLLRGTGISAPKALEDSSYVYQSYVVLLPKEVTPRRSEIIETLREKGIETTIGTYHIPLTTYFRKLGGFRRGDFPATDNVASRAMTLPLHEVLSLDQQEFIVSSLRSLIGALE